MFCLSGKSNVISCDYFPPINLSEGDWEIGLIDLTTYNSIPNVEEEVNNMFYFGKDNPIELPTGSYEIEDIAKYVEERVKKPDELKIKANNNTLKCEIYVTQGIDFTKSCTIGPLLGFVEQKEKLTANIWHVSNGSVDIIRVNVIRIECNIIRGSIDNGNESHVIHEFYPTAETGYKIVEKPSNVIYLPIHVKQIHNITLSIKDQEERPINHRGETVNLRLHLRKKDGVSV